MEDDKQGVPPPGVEGSPEVQPPVIEAEFTPAPPVETTAVIKAPPPPPPPPPAPPTNPEEEEEEGMLRMSFMDHLEELRNRIIKALYGLGIAFVFALVFAGKLWDIISDPAVDRSEAFEGRASPAGAAFTHGKFLYHLGLLAAAVLCLYRLAMDRLSGMGVHLARALQERKAPGLTVRVAHRRLVYHRRLFAYFLAFRYGLEFLLGIGVVNNVHPVVSITEYFDLFVNVMLGVGLVFEMPVLIFLLTLFGRFRRASCCATPATPF